MTAVVVYFDKKHQERTRSFLHTVKEAARIRCDDIRVLDGYALGERERLNMYGYVAVFCAEKPFFSTKPDPAIVTILKDHGLGSTKGCVLTVKHGIFCAKFSRNLMNKLETTGFRIDYFDILRNAADARRAGGYIG